MKWQSKASIDNRSWKYTPALFTNVSKTIARVQKEMKAAGVKANIVKVKT